MWMIFVVVLFVLLTPDILLHLPPKGSKFVVALVHGIVFAFILCFTYKYFMKSVEGFDCTEHKYSNQTKCKVKIDTPS
jgi:hypothetical protein